ARGVSGDTGAQRRRRHVVSGNRGDSRNSRGNREIAPLSRASPVASEALRLRGRDGLYQRKSRMNCRECVEHLYEFLDRELTPEVEREIREHLRSEEHTSELQSRVDLVCRLLLEKKNN